MSNVKERAEAEAEKLGGKIIPLFYEHPKDYARVMRSAIAVNGSFFNTQRMLNQYEANAYYPATMTKREKAER